MNNIEANVIELAGNVLLATKEADKSQSESAVVFDKTHRWIKIKTSVILLSNS